MQTTVGDKSLKPPSPKPHILLKRLLNDVILRIVALECTFKFWKQTLVPNNIEVLFLSILDV